MLHVNAVLVNTSTTTSSPPKISIPPPKNVGYVKTIPDHVPSKPDKITHKTESATRNAGVFPNPIHAAASALCDTLESFISSYIDPHEFPASQNPKVQLATNFAPVHEFPPQECREVTGRIPDCLLGGAYIRNGSNPLHPPQAGYNYFDGHGMLHSVKFPSGPDGFPIYCARFTQTSRYSQELSAGKALFPYFMGTMSSYSGLARLGLFAVRTALGLVDILDGMGTSNAGMAYFDNRILAMSEDDLPYAVHLTTTGDVVTMGRYDFNAKLSLPLICAHPKKDPVTGEFFAFSFNPMMNPYLKYFSVTPDGKKSTDFDINLPEPCLFHDFAVTEHYAVFPENQMVMKMDELILKNKSPFVRDSSKIPRFGVIPRIPDRNSQPIWIDVPDWSSFHYINAWEEGDEIVILSSCISVRESLFDEMSELSNRLCEIHLNLRSRRSYVQHVCSAGIDFGQINHRYLGRKNRFAYLCYYGPWPKFSGLAKIDLDAPRLPRMVSYPADPHLNEPCVASSRRFEPGTFCSEPWFVPSSDGAVEEDDGYVLSYIHNENTGVSELLVMDAKSPTLDTVAAIKLPARVPYGFHGIFVNADEVSKQLRRL